MTSLAYALIILLLLSVAACTGSAQEEETTTILDVIEDNESFTIIALALNDSSLNTVLTGNETHTVFLPTDQAFEDMSEDAFEELTADPEALEQVLLYHVVNGTLTAENLTNVSNVTTLQGSQLPVNVSDEGIFVGDAEVIQADITADNGVVHVIDKLLIPPEGPATENDIIEAATQEGNFTTFLLAIGAANLTEDLKGEGPYTIFAPTDEAFNALPNGTIEALLNDTGTLTETLHYHMTDGRLMAEDLASVTNITTHTGEELPVNVTEEGVFVGNARIVVQDINASNGVIHAIDAVLIPEEAVSGPIELYDDTVNLTAGDFTFTPENDTQTYTIDNLTDFGALNAAGLDFNVSVMQNMTGNVTDNMTGNATDNMSDVSFVLEGMENINNSNTTGEMWFIYINGEPAEENLGMNPVSDGDNLSFWYTTEEGGEAAIGNATYVANITVSVEDGMEPQPGQNLTVLYNDTVNLTAGNFTFTPENSTQNYTVDNFTDIGALNASGLQYNVSVEGVELTGITNMSILEEIEGIRNNNETGERWFIYVNGTEAEEDFGMNPVTNGTNLSFWYATEENGEAAIENATYVANITVAIEEGMEPEPEPGSGQNLTELYNDTVNLTAGNFTFTPENNTQSYEINNLTDFGALNATGLQYNVSVLRALTDENMTEDMTNNTTEAAFVLDGIGGIENNNETGEMWLVYINGEPAGQIFGENNISDGDNLSFWYTTRNGREAAVENATYVANITVAVEEGMAPEPGMEPGTGQNVTELYNDTVNLSAGNVMFRPTAVQNYAIDNLTDFGALYATGLNFTASLAQNMTGNATDNMTNVSFVLQSIENINNSNTTGEMWFIYINGEPAEENLGMNPVSDGDNLSFWYTTEEGGEAAIGNATYVANITVAVEEEIVEDGMEPEPGQNLTVLFNDTVNLTAGNFTFTPENSTQNYTVDNFTDIGALNASGLQYNVSVEGVDLTGITNMSILEEIEGIRNNNETGERWFIYVNGTEAEEDFGMNPVTNGTNLSFWYATEENGEAAIRNATYVANITVAIEEGEEPSEESDIIDTATENGNFTILLAAVEAANLTDTLRGEGPFTVFAPTDEAFNALSNGTIEALLNDTDALTGILLYHVTDERLTSEDVVNLTNITTLQGGELPVNVTDEGVFVGNARIVVQDINASNGVIHVIDAVLIPEEGMEPEPEPGAEPGPGQNLTELYNDTVNLTQGNFTLRPENSTQDYTIDNFTDLGALNASGLDFNVSLMQNMTGNATMGIPFALQSIDGISNNEETGEMWFVYINGEPAEEIFGMNNVSTGDNLSFWYTSEEGGEAAVENATYVVNITIEELRARANIVTAAQNQTNLNTFVNAVQTANLTQALNETGPYTVCIPSNEAFNKLPADTLNQLMNNTALLRQVLSYHVVSGSYTYEQLIRTNNVTNIQGNVLQVNTIGNNITIQNVNVTQIIVVNNGVICIIDEVLIPPGSEIPSGNQIDGNQTDGNQTNGNQTNGNQTNGNQTAGNLTGDWYFFSIPFEANNTSVDYLLADVNYTSLMYYNASTKLFENVTDIEPLKAYWINVPNGTEFNASEQFSSVEKKLVTAPPSLQVYPGWNALGSPVNGTVSAEAAFITLNNSSSNNSFAKIVGPWVPGNNTTGYYRYVGYNGLNGTIGENQLAADEFEVEPYEGYWVFIRQEYLYG
ncbi:fasciclin domain-containing protein [Methanosarcina hadiensis]|uniref:fasciclin domain-containing protein n=1 Tax=Methanosarcina hadiensis TaxID=3078083 RepID=UPI0039773743